jgi:hypothetical protein
MKENKSNSKSNTPRLVLVSKGVGQTMMSLPDMNGFNIINPGKEGASKKNKQRYFSANVQKVGEAKPEFDSYLFNFDVLCGIHSSNPTSKLIMTADGQPAEDGQMGYLNPEVVLNSFKGKIELA